MRSRASNGPSCLWLAVVCLLGISPAAAQTTPAPPPAVTAVRTAEPPEIDGVVDEAVWDQALVIDDFVQQVPLEGVPPTERTVVRILYDDTDLYIAVQCFDRNPSKIRVTSLLRDDFGQNAGESIAFAIDSNDSGRDGFWFSTNPAGAQNDSQVFNEGQIFDPEWDGIWYAEGRIGDEGWEVEIRIPFFNLRFRAGPTNTMRINFFRGIRHKNEEDYAPFIPRNYRGTFSFSIGRPVIFEGISQLKTVDIKPYGLVEADRANEDGTGDRDVEGAVGLENLKWRITPDLTADFTVNPDFAQAEADVFQVNLSRFPLFFPEKREFFLENAGLFRFGVEGSVQAFFSRRIGLDEEGEIVPLVGGARLTGRVGRWSLGILDAVSDETSLNPRNNFAVARLRRDVGKRSTAGMIYTDRRGEGGRTNQVGGADARFVFGEDVFLEGYAMASRDNEGDGDGFAGRVDYRKEGDRWRWNLRAEVTDETFLPEIGFVRRPGITRGRGRLSFRPRPESVDAVRQFFFSGTVNYVEARVEDEALDGRVLDRSWSLDFETEFESGDRVEADYDNVFVRLTEEFEIFDGVVIPPGDYDNTDAEVSFVPWRSRPISGFVSAGAGDFFGGTRRRLGVGVVARFNEHVELDTSYRVNRVRLPYGDFDTNLWVTRVQYGFTPRLFGSALVQWNDVTDDVDLNLRLDWIHHPGADLFIVYNQSTNTDRLPGEPQTNFRQGIVKLTWLFQF